VIKYLSDRKIRKSSKNNDLSQIIRVSGISSTRSATANEHPRQTNSTDMELSYPFKKSNPHKEEESKEEENEANKRNSMVRFALDEGDFEVAAEMELSDDEIQEMMTEEIVDPMTHSPIATDEVAEKDETSIKNEAGEKVVESQNADIDLTTPTSDRVNGGSMEVGIDEEKKDENDTAVNKKVDEQ